MTKAYISLFLFAIVGLTACATPQKPPEMMGAQPAGIGISISILFVLVEKGPEAVYFVKVSGRDNVLSPYPAIRSNYVKGSNAYLLNAEPGLYAAVAASYSDVIAPVALPSTGGVTVTGGGVIGRVLYFPEDLIRKTIADVKPGAISYLGTYEINVPWSVGFRDADRAQQHYRSQFQTGYVSTLQATEKKSARDATSEKDFFQRARDDFSESDWSKIVR